MPEWTEAQEAAISHRGGHVVCAAAAGAGKTAVLTERVVRRLADPAEPVDVDQLLVVTFTRAAAAEMRRRIGQALRERAAGAPSLWRQAWLLPHADITTLHGFCERTLRRNFAEAGCDPQFALLDPAEAASLRAECLDRLIDERYRGGGPFLEAVTRYGGRRLDSALRPLILRLHDFALSQEDPQAWIAGAAAGMADPAFAEARCVASRALATAARRTERAIRLAAGPDGPEGYLRALESDARMLEALLAAADGPWDDFAAALRTAGFVPLPPAGRAADQLLSERVRHLRDATKAQVRAAAAGPFGRREAELTAEATTVAAAVRPLTDLVAELQNAYLAAKRGRNALDFADLEHEALRLLRGPAGAAIGERYHEVLVDESQDLSPVQDGLLSALCGRAPLFAVGDLRQSIYGFRLADPTRFLARTRLYAEGGGGVRIALPHNFRSRRAIISGVNYLFDRLFPAPGAEIPPAEAGPLLYGADYGERDEPIGLLLLEGDMEAEESTATEREAEAVAELCARWVGRASVRERDGLRPARPGDVAVLLRALSGVAPLYAEALAARGLPSWVPAGGGRAGSPEVEAVLAWLAVLDNPRQDIPLAAALRGPFGDFSDAELAEVRLAAPRGDLWDGLQAVAAGGDGLARRAGAWLLGLEGWRTAARRGGYAELLGSALAASRYRARAGGLPGGRERLRNLDWAEERCHAAERVPGLDLPGLIEFLRRGDSGETVAEGAAAAGDAVRILSVHGSKGLEFPLVVVAGLGRRFNLSDRTGDVLVHREAGLGARVVDPQRHLRWPGLRHAAVAARIAADTRAEELRLLYVAMTRAREGLHLVGSLRGLEERAAEWLAGGPDPDLDDGACPLDWLGPVLAGHPDVALPLASLRGAPLPAAPPDPGGSRWSVELRLSESAESLPDGATPPAAESDQPPGAGAEREDALARLRAEAAWRYPFADRAALPAKVTVGELRDAAAGEEEPAAPLRPAASEAPRAGTGGLTPAEIGSATHLLLRHIDPRGGTRVAQLRTLADSLAARALLAPAAAGAIDTEAVAAYLRRPLGQRFAAAHAAGALRREVPFALRLPAAEVHRGLAESEEWVLVQGVFDALLLEGAGLVLIDYKTDHLDGPAGLERAVAHHRPQLALYARAAAAAWGRPVAEAWLCFLAAGRDIPVPLNPQAG